MFKLITVLSLILSTTAFKFGGLKPKTEFKYVGDTKPLDYFDPLQITSNSPSDLIKFVRDFDMKKILFYTTLVICSTFHSQDDWTLYPKKEALDSLNIQSTELLKSINHDSTQVHDSIQVLETKYTDSLYYLSNKGVLVENKDSKIDSINNYLWSQF